MKTNVKPTDYDDAFTQARTLCHGVHGEEGKFGMVYMKRDHTTPVVQSVHHSFGTFAEQEGRLEQYAADGWEPYMMVAVTAEAGNSRNIVQHTWAVAADFDNGLPELFELNELICPSYVVITSAGRCHAVWVFDAICTPAQMQFLAVTIQDRFDGDAAFARTNQTVRMPGFLNRKNGDKVKLHDEYQSGKLHSYDTLCHAFDAPLVANLERMLNPRMNESLTISRTQHSATDMVKDATSALPHLKHLASEYDSWVRIGIALAGLGKDGEKLFHTFSAYSAAYDADAVTKKWPYLLKAADSSSIRPLFYAAQREGWTNPGFRDQKVAPSVLTDRDFGAMCAEVMHAEFAVIEHPSKKGPPQFLKQEGGSYRLLTDIERRSEAERAAKEVIANLASEGVQMAWLKKIGTIKGLNDVCEHIAEVLILKHEGNKVRSFPYFPFKGGVLNLLSLEVVPKKYRPLPVCANAIVYDPEAKAPLFTRVVNEIFENDETMVRFMFQLFGLMLLGRPEQYFFVWLGRSASNGKSLLVKVMKSVLGPYFTYLPTAALMVKSHTSDGANPAIAQLTGKRLAVVSEPTAKQSLDSSLIKQLTGDGHVNVRDNYGAPKDMQVEAVILMVANYMPAAMDDDNGLWRRALIVPFDRTFTPEEDDKNLADKLEKEKSGILNMMLAGAHDYLKHGLIVPEKVRNFVRQQRHEVDPFEAFFVDCLIESPGSVTFLKDIYAAYMAWHKQNTRFRRITKPELSKRLQRLFHKGDQGHLPVFEGVTVIGA
jgi:P4 family phage/plasmid primase-like protien